MEKDVEASIVPIIQAMGGSRDNIVEIIEKDEPLTDSDKDIQNESIKNSTNMNTPNKDSLTYSQISIISKTNDNCSHLYSSPESVANEGKCIEQHLSNDNLNGNCSKFENQRFEIPSPHQLPLPQKSIVVKERKFPVMIALGAVQLMLSIILAALGGLVIARNASLSMAFSGIWAGAVAGVAGSLAIINVKSAQTGFLAVSLISVATGTLASSLTGIGLLRDWNVVQQDEVIINFLNYFKCIICFMVKF